MLKIGISLPAALVASTVFGHAQDFEPRGPVYTLNSSIGTEDEVVEETTGVFANDQLSGVTTEFGARYEWRNAAGDQLFLDPLVSLQVYPSERDVNQLRFGLFGEYRHRLAENENLQLRLRAGIEHANDLSNPTFNRLTLQAMLNARHNERHVTDFRLRYRYRDQNEAYTFDGFDQREFLISARHAWQPSTEKLTLIAATLYADLRAAEAERFSYTEVGGRVQVRYELSDNIRMTGRLKAYTREYKDAFSSTFDFTRSDHRIGAEIEARYTLGEDRHIYGAVGWDRNASNVSIRQFSGPTIRIGYAVTWR